jgi:hypothetical protein
MSASSSPEQPDRGTPASPEPEHQVSDADDREALEGSACRVQALIMVWRARDGAGLDTVLRNPSPVVTRMLKLTGLGPVLAVEHTTADEPDQAR